MKFISRYILGLITLLVSLNISAQQDPQFTQYMYNTMSINPAYAGSKGYESVILIGRTQWVGFEGAPDTQTFSYQAPVGSSLGLGFNIMNDVLGPSQEFHFDANLSYTIRTGYRGNLAFGMRLGGRMLNIDWSKGRFQNPDALFNQNIENRFLPTIGSGLYYYTDNFYVGLSIPNFLTTEHYDDNIEALANENIHYFFMAGLVFDISDYIKFKPALLSKVVAGSPVSIDVSANMMFYERFTFGLAYRLDDSISGLVNFQVSNSLQIGYAYDMTTSNFQNYNSGTHEIMLIYDILRYSKFKSPRFF